MDKRIKTKTSRLDERIRQVIAGTPTGDRLPSEPKLAQRLGVSRATLRESMRTFESQGMIHRRQGVGTFVIQPSQVIETGLEVLESINTLARRIDLEVKMGKYRVNQRASTAKEAEFLSLETGHPVTELAWAMEADSRPVAYLVDIVPEEILSEETIKAEFNGSVLDLLIKRKRIPLATSRTEINAVAAPPKIAQSLDIPKNTVLLYFEATLFSAEGKAVDYSTSYYLPGYFRFHVLRRVGSGSAAR